MSAPIFNNYPGMEAQSDAFHYSQTVIVGKIVRASGQGGWDADGHVVSDPSVQVEWAFANVEKALQAAHEGLSWQHVYAVRSYHTNIDQTAAMVISAFSRYMPNRKPVWTSLEVSKLGIEGMVVEIEVEALL